MGITITDASVNVDGEFCIFNVKQDIKCQIHALGIPLICVQKPSMIPQVVKHLIAASWNFKDRQSTFQMQLFY